MYRRAIFVTAFLCCAAWPSAFAGPPGYQTAPADPLRYDFVRAGESKSRVAALLRELARVNQAATTAGVARPAPPEDGLFMLDAADRVLVRITARDIDALLPVLVARGFKVTGTRPALHFLEGYLPINEIDRSEGLANDGMLGIRAVPRPVLYAGSVLSQADQVLETGRVRAALPTGYDGTGIRIGVLSDSYNNQGGAAAGVASGDLPAGVQVLEDLPSGGSDEGRAMMELIHDLAPGSPLSFATAFTGQAAFADNIIALKDANCKVIVDDVGYLFEPFYQDGVIAQAVTAVFIAGSNYFSAAGNMADQAFESTTYSETIDANPPGGVGDQWFDFDSGPGVDTRQLISIPSLGTIRIVLQWDNPFDTLNGVVTDLDFYLVAPGTNVPIRTSVEPNIDDQFPVEYIEYRNFSVDPLQLELMIRRFEGPPPTRVKYVNFGEAISGQFQSAARSTVSPHASAVGGIAVAAAPYFGHTAVETFSSWGPFTVLFDPDGTRKPTPEVRDKPDLTAIDGTDTTFFGTDVEGNGFPNFFGTSAAAPHAAAVAALVRQSNAALSANQTRLRLLGTAEALPGATPGFDIRSGAGLINAYAAVFGSPVPVGLPFQETFESSVLGAMWEVNTTVNGRVRVTGSNSPFAGARHALLDTFFSSLSRPSRKDMILHFDGASTTCPQLTFTQRHFGDAGAAMPESFLSTDAGEFNGVAISVNGINWYRILSLHGANSSTSNQTRTFSIHNLAAGYGITLGPDTRIMFRQYSFSTVPAGGFAFDNIELFDVASPDSIQIVNQPASKNICIFDPLNLNVNVTSVGDVTYQWKKNGMNIAGATSATFTIPSVAPTDAGAYSVTITNPCFSLTSDAAVVTVSQPYVCDPTVGFLGCPADMQLAATSPAGAALAFALPRVEPPSDRVILNTTHQPGTTFPVGETVVTFSVFDPVSGHTRSCSFKVTVLPSGQSQTGGSTGSPGSPGGGAIPNVACFTTGLVDASLLAVSTALLCFWPRHRRRWKRPS